MFCKLAVSLLLTDGWTLKCDDSKPECLFRNCLQYCIQQKWIVTLIDPLFRGFFEVYTNFQLCDGNDYSKTVRDLMRAINESFDMCGVNAPLLNHRTTAAEPRKPEQHLKTFLINSGKFDSPKLAFICTSDKCKGSKQHHAFGDPYTKQLTCSKQDGVFIMITDSDVEKYKIWGDCNDYLTDVKTSGSSE